ncbi:SnoaL-like polyketide cyclase-domain-containing protein [Nemania sp. FL0916]|nr:SnoaL-like polyketide cyclase-domain-containing protein [Nemania sp. FL0916]
MEAIFRSYIQCVNDDSLEDLPDIMWFPLALDGGSIPSAEVLVKFIRSAARLHIDIDALTTNEETQCLAAKLVKTQDGEDSTIGYTQQAIVRVQNGKISRINSLAEEAEVQRLRSDLISAYDHGSGDARLSARELEDTYRNYIGSINARTMVADLPKFCHLQVTYNAERLPLEKYRGLMDAAIAAIPDVVFGIDALVVDAPAQRVAARIQFDGTPTGPFAGVEPTGSSVRFYEHVTYQFRDGKIDRVWSIVDLKSYRKQLS